MTSVKTEAWAEYARELGVALSPHRHRVGLSQERVAHAAGVTRGYYQQLESGTSRTGRVANPTIQNLIALAQVLETTVAELLPPSPPDLTEGR